MPVYVDDMRAPFGTMLMCHMMADSDDELHAMADLIGVSRRWWQAPPKASASHYDIALSKRSLAIRSGAIAVTTTQIGIMNRRRRQTGKFGPVEDAERWYAQEYEDKNEIKPSVPQQNTLF